ncbi:MAG TPA: HEAT repeat domain-containing protein, partial [Phycisphaerae bacterium]|nr:HEAT repeat domain-containing protein [Phycisphaerae bacterium]
AIGDLKYAPAEKRLLEMISTDKAVGERYIRVIPSVVYALVRLGHVGYKRALGPMLTSEELGIRANAAMVMGKIGDPAARGPLREVLYNEQELGVKLAMEEALANLGDKAARGRLEAYARGRFVDVRINACMAMAKYNPNHAKVILRSFFNSTDQNSPVRLISAAELGRLGCGDRKTYEYCVSCAVDPDGVLMEAYPDREGLSYDESLFLRRQGILALGWTQQPMAVDLLLQMLKDEDPSIRISAAISILRLLDGGRYVEQPGEQPPAPETKPDPDPKTQTPDGEESFIKDDVGKRKLHRSGIDD